jgi:hypothetical protein
VFSVECAFAGRAISDGAGFEYNLSDGVDGPEDGPPAAAAGAGVGMVCDGFTFDASSGGWYVGGGSIPGL